MISALIFLSFLLLTSLFNNFYFCYVIFGCAGSLLLCMAFSGSVDEAALLRRARLLILLASLVPSAGSVAVAQAP